MPLLPSLRGMADDEVLRNQGSVVVANSLEGYPSGHYSCHSMI